MLNILGNTYTNGSGTQYNTNTLTIRNCSAPHASDRSRVESGFRRGLPPPVIDFCGRDPELENIFDYLKNASMTVLSQATAISGLGGIGKTEVAKAFAAKFDKEYDIILYIIGDSNSSLTNAFYEIASDFEIPIQRHTIEDEKLISVMRSVKDIADDIYQRCTKYRSTLIIFDNIEEQKDVIDYLPNKFSDKIHILITSRKRDWDLEDYGNIKVIHVDVFTLETATEFISKSLKEHLYTKDNIDELCELLAYFPLALKQATSFIRTQNRELKNTDKYYTIDDYIEDYKICSETLLKYRGDYSMYLFTVMNTWKITIDKLKNQYEDIGMVAIKILEWMAYFSPNNIPIEIFLVNEDRMSRQAINLLEDYSMINIENFTINIHRLVQKVLKINILNDNREHDILDELTDFLDDCKYFKDTSLVFACRNGMEDVIRFILETDKYDLNQEDCYGCTPLFNALNINVTRMLVESGKINMNHADVYGRTVLMWAAARGDVESFTYLLNGGKCDVNKRDYMGQTILMYVSYLIEDVELLKIILNNSDVNVNWKDNDGKTVLMLTSWKKKPDIINVLMNNEKINVYDRDEKGWTALMHACASGNFETFKLLIESGRFDMNVIFEDRKMYLLQACSVENLEMIRFIFNTFIDKYNGDYAGLMCVCLNKDLEIVQYVAENCVQSVNVKYDIVKTLLKLWWCGNLDIFEFFLNSGMVKLEKIFLFYTYFDTKLSVLDILLMNEYDDIKNNINKMLMEHLQSISNEYGMHDSENDIFTQIEKHLYNSLIKRLTSSI